ncbi:penicillin-binding transpeptidase domain-containing protein [Streptomyces sp. NPDC020801]|uniref:penicillin-binding transpeptidase domain-containing protein n=1 Tax=unclassified Streptomyces TaxID=2593676 RepID=UPI003799DCB8
MPHAGSQFSVQRRRWPLPTAVCTLVLTAAGGGAYATGWGPFAGDGASADPAAVAEGRAFLADWASDRVDSAGKRTTSPDRARTVLTGFTQGLDISRPQLTAGQASTTKDGTVNLSFTAKMPVKGLGTWTYTSTLPLKKESDGAWKVDWRLSLVHPHLSDNAKFHLDRKSTSKPEITDRNGEKLSGTAGLTAIVDRLADSRSGGAIQLVDRTTGEVKRTEVTFGKASSARPDESVRTTIDPTWQTAAERDLSQLAGKNAALVALRIDNGQVLAVANSPADDFNRAFSGTYAPGSTWKIITSAALLLKGAVKPDDMVDCPQYLPVDGRQFQNAETSEHHNTTLRTDFALSCNTAFISLRDKLGDDELSSVARQYFGVGQNWHTGVPSFDGLVPTPANQVEKASEMIGQGRVLANPLIMASVAATAVSGSFHQPTILQGATGTARTTRLPGTVVTQLRDMMRATVTQGTATVLADLPGDVGAKTGTAEVGKGQPNNGWLVAHRGNVAIACVVEGGGTGAGSAGPIIHQLLSATSDIR